MKITEICIKRPVLSTVMSLILLILGYVGFKNLQVRQYPNVDQPRVSVVTQYSGAGPEIIEAQITKILENVFSGIEGLETMVSRSEIGQSRISLSFNLNRDLDAAANDVRDKLGRIRDRLPQNIPEPRIKKADSDASAFISLVLFSDRHDVRDIADFASRTLESRFESVPGVSNVEITGGGHYEMRLILDPVRMKAFQISSDDVASALRKQNVEKPAGNITIQDRELIVTTRANLKTEKDFNGLIVGKHKGYLVRLSDIGRAELNAIDKHSKVLFNDKNAVSIDITKQSVANALSISKDIKKLMPQIRLPDGMKMEVALDRTIFVEKSIDEVYETIYIASLLVILVIFLFLRSLRAIFIPLVTIPLSLIGVFALMYSLGFTINILTLLAMVLAIGLVVDDAIVMLENVYRYIEEGESPLKASFRGAKEISFAILAMTVTLAAVYAPIALSPGMTGKLFTEFAITLAGAVVISGFIALTLTPMMCSRLLKPHAPSRISLLRFLDRQFQGFFHLLDKKYHASLEMCLHYRKTTLFLGFLVALSGYFLAVKTPSELIPEEDQGIVNVKGIPPFGANLAYVKRYMDQANALVKEVPEVEKRLALINSPGESYLINGLATWENRTRSSRDIVDALKEPLENITGMRMMSFVGGKSILSSGRSDDAIHLVVKGSKTQKELIKATQRVAQIVLRQPGVYGVQTDSSEDGQEYEVTVSRDKAASLGVDVSNIGDTLDTLISGRTASRFKRDNRIYDVKLMVDDTYKTSPEDITGLFIRGVKDNRETLVPLSEIVTIKKSTAPIEVIHYEGMRAMNIYGKLKKGFSLGTTLQDIREKSNETLSEGHEVDFAGESMRFMKESKSIYEIFGLALIFIFLVLAAQYESWRDPFIIMLSVPLSLAGGALALKLFDQTMNLYSQIGFVTLIGLITKHGILIVDFANAQKEKGLSLSDAVLEASKLRLRPILMTTFAMVLGAVPLAFAEGAGSESRQPIGLVIVGGMTLGTLFTLYIVPVFYTFLSRHKKNQEPLENA